MTFEDPLPHAIRMSPSCFGFLIQSRHVQPIKSGHVPATSEFPAPSEFPFIALSAQIPTGLRLEVWGLGFGVWGLGFWVWGLGFGGWGLGFGVWGLGFGVWGLGIGVWVWGVGFRVDQEALLGRLVVVFCLHPEPEPVSVVHLHPV